MLDDTKVFALLINRYIVIVRHIIFRINTEFSANQKLLLRILLTGVSLRDLRNRYPDWIAEVDTMLLGLLSDTYNADEQSLETYLLDYALVIRRKHDHIAVQGYREALILQKEECQFTDLSYELIFSDYGVKAAKRNYILFIWEDLELEFEKYLSEK